MYKCDKVIVTPDNKRIKVFNKGISQGEKMNGAMPTGGHCKPNSTVGDIDEWKKLQKKATKNITSEKINNNIETIKLLWIGKVWNPSKLLSRIISLNQIKSTQIAAIKQNKAYMLPLWYPCKYTIKLVGIPNITKDNTKGHGLCVTMCQKCWLFIVYVFPMIFYLVV